MNNSCCQQDDAERAAQSLCDLGESHSGWLETLRGGAAHLFVGGAIALSLLIAAALSGAVGPFSGRHALDAAWTSQPPLAEQAQRTTQTAFPVFHVSASPGEAPAAASTGNEE